MPGKKEYAAVVNFRMPHRSSSAVPQSSWERVVRICDQG
jgi:hypothetical protein